MSRPSRLDQILTVRAALLVTGGLVVLRVLAIMADPNTLYPDETQYWLWSRELDWGYFSKPPLIAWVIWTMTSVFGNADWAVRLAAPFFHAFTALMLGLTGARLFGDRAGVLAGLLWLTMPAVWLSSLIMATDSLLMAGWSAGLYALIRLREGPDWRFAILLGVALGWAFLAKYAAIYFLLGAVLAMLVDAPARRALISLQGLAAGAIFLALISGNLLWNSANGFVTVQHTAANANWVGDLFDPRQLFGFLGDQFGVFGPIAFPALIAAVIAAFRTFSLRDWRAARPRLVLAVFTAPPVLIVAAGAFISRAHAGWAASAYAAGTILVAAWFLEGGRWRRAALAVSIGLHAVAGLTLMALAASTSLSEAAGLANAYKRVRGWPATVEAVADTAQTAGAAAIAFDNRNDFHQMQRYGDSDAPLFMWMRYASAHNFAEAGWPLPEGVEGPILIVSERPDEIPLMARDFARFEPAGEIRIPLGGGRERVYRLFLAEGYDPLVRDEQYEAQVESWREAYGAPVSASSPQT